MQREYKANITEMVIHHIWVLADDPQDAIDIAEQSYLICQHIFGQLIAFHTMHIKQLKFRFNSLEDDITPSDDVKGNNVVGAVCINTSEQGTYSPSELSLVNRVKTKLTNKTSGTSIRSIRHNIKFYFCSLFFILA